MTVNQFDANLNQSAHYNSLGLDAQTGSLVPPSQYGLDGGSAFSPGADLSVYRGASNDSLADFSNYEPLQSVYEDRLSNSNNDELTGLSNQQVVDAVSVSTPSGSATPATTNDYFEQRVFDLTNEQRQQAGLQPLQMNDKLDRAADAHSEDMALRHYFSHNSLDGSPASARADKEGYNYSKFGENIAAGQATPEEVVQGWMNSPGHRANILNPNFKDIGVGYYYLANDSGYHSYWTQDFGTLPGSATPTPAISGSATPTPATSGSATPTPTTSGGSATPTPATAATKNDSFEQRVFDLTNEQRQQAGLQPLQMNDKLDRAADAHSEDMALQHYFSHNSLDGSPASDRVKKEGYNYSTFGENIAAGQTTPEDVVQGWMNSPGHRANILNPNFKEIGVGYYYLANDSGYHSYWTQDFGTALKG